MAGYVTRHRLATRETHTMQRRTLLAGTAALAAAPLLRARAQAAKTKIVWWHAMTAALGEQVTRIADDVQRRARTRWRCRRSTRAATPTC